MIHRVTIRDDEITMKSDETMKDVFKDAEECPIQAFQRSGEVDCGCECDNQDDEGDCSGGVPREIKFVVENGHWKMETE